MVRSPCSDSNNLKKGPWTQEEDEKLVDYINRHGHTNWKALPKLAGLNRCGKSCRLRWINYLRPDIKRGKFSDEEELLIINLHSVLGNKWSMIATHLPGRTDNEIKNFWNTHLRKKLLHMGIDPLTHKPRTDLNHLVNLSQLLGAAQFGNFGWDHNVLKLQAEAAQLAKIHLMERLLGILNTSTLSGIDFTSLMGSQHNGADPLYTKEPTQARQGLFNPITPQALISDLHASSANSWACYEGALDISNKSLTSCWDIQTEEHQLPPLISASVTPEPSTVNKTEGNTTNPSSQLTNSSTSPFFEAWERLIDDEICSSFWKDILEN